MMDSEAMNNKSKVDEFENRVKILEKRVKEIKQTIDLMISKYDN